MAMGATTRAGAGSCAITLETIMERLEAMDAAHQARFDKLETQIQAIRNHAYFEKLEEQIQVENKEDQEQALKKEVAMKEQILKSETTTQVSTASLLEMSTFINEEVHNGHATLQLLDLSLSEKTHSTPTPNGGINFDAYEGLPVETIGGDVPPPVHDIPVEPQSLRKLSLKLLKRGLDLFAPSHGASLPCDVESKRIRSSYKVTAEYGGFKNLPSEDTHDKSKNKPEQASATLALPGIPDAKDTQKGNKGVLALAPPLLPKAPELAMPSKSSAIISVPGSSDRFASSSALIERIPSIWPKPEWHPPWKYCRVISGHLEWVRSIAIDPSKTWFCTGSADRTIKIWDVASGRLKLTLTGHIEQIRG